MSRSHGGSGGSGLSVLRLRLTRAWICGPVSASPRLQPVDPRWPPPASGRAADRELQRPLGWSDPARTIWNGKLIALTARAGFLAHTGYNARPAEDYSKLIVESRLISFKEVFFIQENEPNTDWILSGELRRTEYGGSCSRTA
jgi:hypothetical protein